MLKIAPCRDSPKDLLAQPESTITLDDPDAIESRLYAPSHTNSFSLSSYRLRTQSDPKDPTAVSVGASFFLSSLSRFAKRLPSETSLPPEHSADQIEAGACANSSRGTFEPECATRGNGSRQSSIRSASGGWWPSVWSSRRVLLPGGAIGGWLRSGGGSTDEPQKVDPSHVPV
ncbi:hypothetical protein T484DRAFT_1972919, partial [Baffinella frigidus]